MRMEPIARGFWKGFLVKTADILYLYILYEMYTHVTTFLCTVETTIIYLSIDIVVFLQLLIVIMITT
jgi:hypothetical protein